MSVSCDPTGEVRFGVRRLVGDLVGRDPSPLTVIDTSRQVAAHAGACFRDAVRDARAEGLTWQEIAGGVPGFDRLGEDGPSALFCAVATDGTFERCLHWRCPTCDAVIADGGPRRELPWERERGHALGCLRLCRLIAAADIDWPED